MGIGYPRGIKEVHFADIADTRNVVDIPPLLRIPHTLGDIGVIHGKK
jgi:hypothetical protein